MKRTRLGALLGVTLAVGLAARPAQAAVDWGPQQDLPPDHTWNFGSSLATTGTYLHGLYVTDDVDGTFATDHGPFQGVYYLRSQDEGSTWTDPFRVNAVDKHGTKPAIATAGAYVYTAWVSQASYEHYDPADPRSALVRVNSDHGAPNAWGQTIRLSKATGRMDQVDVAASGSNVFLAWTDAKKGAIRVAMSTDHGVDWQVRTIGFAHAVEGPEGRVGTPAIAASGDDVGVVWVGSARGTVKASISTNGGKTWRTPLVLADSGGSKNGGSPAADALGERLAFGWTTGHAVSVRVWAGSWESTRTVARFEPGTTHEGGYDVAVALDGADVIGVAWSDCDVGPCDLGSANARVDLSWSESADGGTTWTSRKRLQGSGASVDQRINDGASVVYLGATRFVLYDGRAVNYVAYDLFLRVGTGTA